jgi:hypothetical protein
MQIVDAIGDIYLFRSSTAFVVLFRGAVGRTTLENGGLEHAVEHLVRI